MEWRFLQCAQLSDLRIQWRTTDTASPVFRRASVSISTRTGYRSWSLGRVLDSNYASLAIDRNGNGQIDNGSELFGNHSPIYGGESDVTAANGFEVLKFLDSPATGAARVPDGRLDMNDPVFERLLLWRDLNHNGISEPGELTRAVDEGIVAIGTDYRVSRKTDKFGMSSGRWGGCNGPTAKPRRSSTCGCALGTRSSPSARTRGRKRQ